MKLSVLFSDPDIGWGLRGDPHLWDELERRFRLVDLPENAEAFVELLEREYRAITGQPIEVDERVYVEEFDHGGMSSGHVCPEYWRDRAIPYLLQRFERHSQLDGKDGA